MTKVNAIFLFDSKCMMCSKFVHFLIKKDKEGLLKFSSLEGTFAAENIEKRYLENKESSIYIKNGKKYYNSTAILLLLKDLSVKPLLNSVLLKIPSIMRNSVYSFISKNRHKFFKNDACLLIDKSRFI